MAFAPWSAGGVMRFPKMGRGEQIEIAPPETAQSTSAVDRVVGSQIRAFRIDAAMSLANLAHRIGIPPSELAEIEAGRKRCEAARLVAIADILEQPVLVFFNDDADFEKLSRRPMR